MATIRLSDETKQALDAYTRNLQQQTGGVSTQSDAVQHLLAEAEAHSAESVLDTFESEGIATVRRMLANVADEMAGILIHEKHTADEATRAFEKERNELAQSVADLKAQRDRLAKHVEELEPIAKEVESLRSRLTEESETRRNTDKLLADMEHQRTELLARFSQQADAQTTLLDEIRSTREELTAERSRNQELKESVERLISSLSRDRGRVDDARTNGDPSVPARHHANAGDPHADSSQLGLFSKECMGGTHERPILKTEKAQSQAAARSMRRI